MLKQRKAFFSFHFGNDSWRYHQVVNSQRFMPTNVIRANVVRPFLAPQDWEGLKRTSDAAVERWIDGQMSGTSVTVVLIGSETSTRRWIDYEIKKTWSDGKGLLGIRIHGLKDRSGNTAVRGDNPFANFTFRDEYGMLRSLDDFVPVHDWNSVLSPYKIGDWINAAAEAVGR